MPGGTKEEKFIRLAESRVNRAIKDLRLVGNLANKNNYSYTDEQVDKILAALRKELRDLKSRFSRGGVDDDDRFVL